MSIKLMAAAWELDIPSTEKMVLLCLADFCNDGGSCWPSVATIARKCSKSPRTVQAAIQWLRAEGYCSWDDEPGRPHKFALNPRKICTPAEFAPPQLSTHTPAESAPEPSRTTNGLSNDKPKRARKVERLPVPAWMPEANWEAFLDMRRRKTGKPPSDDAHNLLIGRLTQWRAKGHDPGEILDNSTLNNWTGIFEPKGPHNDRSRSSNDRPTTREIGERVAARLAAGSGGHPHRLLELGPPGRHVGEGGR